MKFRLQPMEFSINATRHAEQAETVWTLHADNRFVLVCGLVFCTHNHGTNVTLTNHNGSLSFWSQSTRKYDVWRHCSTLTSMARVWVQQMPVLSHSDLRSSENKRETKFIGCCCVTLLSLLSFRNSVGYEIRNKLLKTPQIRPRTNLLCKCSKLRRSWPRWSWERYNYGYSTPQSVFFFVAAIIIVIKLYCQKHLFAMKSKPGIYVTCRDIDYYATANMTYWM